MYQMETQRIRITPTFADVYVMKRYSRRNLPYCLNCLFSHNTGDILNILELTVAASSRKSFDVYHYSHSITATAGFMMYDNVN